MLFFLRAGVGEEGGGGGLLPAEREGGGERCADALPVRTHLLVLLDRICH